MCLTLCKPCLQSCPLLRVDIIINNNYNNSKTNDAQTCRWWWEDLSSQGAKTKVHEKQLRSPGLSQALNFVRLHMQGFCTLRTFLSGSIFFVELSPILLNSFLRTRRTTRAPWANSKEIIFLAFWRSPHHQEVLRSVNSRSCEWSGFLWCWWWWTLAVMATCAISWATTSAIFEARQPSRATTWQIRIIQVERHCMCREKMN